MTDTAEAAPREQAPSSSFDQPFQAALARLTGGISLLALRVAFAGWFDHLAVSPDKQIALALSAARAVQDVAAGAGESARGFFGASEAALPDRRFAAAAWRSWPFDVMARAFLAWEGWWRAATTDVPGVSRHHADIVGFTVRQLCSTRWRRRTSPGAIRR